MRKYGLRERVAQEQAQRMRQFWIAACIIVVVVALLLGINRTTTSGANNSTRSDAFTTSNRAIDMAYHNEIR